MHRADDTPQPLEEGVARAIARCRGADTPIRDIIGICHEVNADLRSVLLALEFQLESAVRAA